VWDEYIRLATFLRREIFVRKILTVSGLAALLLVPSSFASTITSGSFDISGTIYVTNPESTPVVTAAGTCPTGIACILWQDGAGTTNGEVDISSAGLPNGNIPASIAGTNAADMANLMDPPDAVGTAIDVPDFITFNSGVTTDLTLTYIEPGIYTPAECGAAPAVGQTCTPPGSLFNLVNNPPPVGQATVTWVMEGTTTSGSTWIGNFTTQFPAGTPYQTVLTDLATNGFVDNTFSGTITLMPAAQTPEPATLTLMGTGLILLALGLRRRKRIAR
jgi:hypothetical protein